MASLGCSDKQQNETKFLKPEPSQILTVFKKDNTPIHITLDGGATGSFMRLDYALKHKFKIYNNNQKAGLADSKTKVNSVGYVEETFYRDNWSVSFKGLVVPELSADIYGGQPFLKENDISTRPAKNLITVHGKYTVLQTNPTISKTIASSASLITLARLNVDKAVVFPGQELTIQLPTDAPCDKVAIEPRIENKIQTWPVPQIVENIDGYINIKNDATEPIIIPTDVNLVSITNCDDSSNKPTTKFDDTPLPERKNHVHTVNQCINTAPLNNDNIIKLHNIHTQYQDVFDGKMTGYNGHYGQHVVSLRWADSTRPKTERIHAPKWSSSKDVMLQKKIDQLTDMGVLADPYQHNIQVKCMHPCFIQKKARAGTNDLEKCDTSEIRFLTAPSLVNEKCRQIQTHVPNQTEIFKFVAKNPCLIYADLYESFFQNHLHKKDWGYMAIQSPFKGLRVYTRSTQGLLNQDEELSQLLFKVLGQEIMDGRCMKIADDLVIGGKNHTEAIANWEKVLQRLSLANLKLSPSKVRIFPKQANIFGWRIENGKITPDPHRQLAIVKSQFADIDNIGDLRSWMGIYKTFLIAMPGLAGIMDPFDKLCAGIKDSKTKIEWTPTLIEKFQEATTLAGSSIKYLTLPKPDEQLILMPDATVRNPAIGFVLFVEREDQLLPVTFYSFKLNDHQTNWFPCEREALGLATAVKKCDHFILESEKPTLVLTDSKPVVDAYNLIRSGKFSASARMSSFLFTTNQFRIDVQHISGKFKQNIAADYLSRNPMECKNLQCQLCKFVHDMSYSVAADIQLNDIHTNEYPMGNKSSWLKIQSDDFACSEALKRLQSGQQPAKKGNFSNDIRRYYNYCQAKDLLVCQEKIPNTTQTFDRIVVPKDYVASVLSHLHYRENQHLSVYQLEKVFNRYYFGIHTKQVAHEIVQGCVLCQTNKSIPKSMPSFETISNPSHPGQIFNADVMRRDGKYVLVCRDLFSSYTVASVIKDEKAETLMNGLIDLISNIRSNDDIYIRTDAASGFKALSSHPVMERLKIHIQTTDPSNKNSVASVDNAIKELEQEMIKIAPYTKEVNRTTLQLAIQHMNSKIRNRGLSAYEIIFSRENNSSKNLHIDDKNLMDEQIHHKEVNNKNTAKCISTKPQKREEINIGDSVAIKNEKNKNKIRDVYLVTNVFPDKVQLNKILRYHSTNSKIQSQQRIVHVNDIFKILPQSHTLTNDKIDAPVQKPKIAKNEKKVLIQKPWSPFGKIDVSFDSENEDYNTQTTQNSSHQAENAEDHDDVDDDPSSSDGDSNDNEGIHNLTDYDPYQDHRQWEANQRIHARKSLNYQICSPNQQKRANSRMEWDHQFDTQQQLHNEEENLDDVVAVIDEAIERLSPTTQVEENNTNETLSPMSKVQNIDAMIDAELANVDTNQCQNLEKVLPLVNIEKPKTKKKKKRISPPRKDLPLERKGPITRSKIEAGKGLGNMLL